MELCLLQAQQAQSLCPPNPAVGALVVNAAGDVIGSGHTQVRGGPHAEIMALRDAASRGHDVRGASVYVTLEPCSHQGRTGPCCDALIAAGVGRVVASCMDPNPLVSGQGFSRLRAAGVTVEVGPGAAASRELNIGFFSRMVRKRPWVRLKAAVSLDGKTALSDGSSQWITSEAARRDGHAWRARAQAILTGTGTVLRDNPRLDIRLAQGGREPLLAIVDTRLETPVDAQLFAVARPVLIYTASQDALRRQRLQDRGAVIIDCPEDKISSGSGAGGVDLAGVLHDLARREINEVHVEAGHRLNGALIYAGLVDELLIYMAPKLIGPGLEMAGLAPITALSAAPALRIQSVEQIPPDVRIIARFAGADDF